MKDTISSVISELIAAIPALLGFVPHDSLVLLATVSEADGPPTLGPMMRVDLTSAEQDPAGCIGQWAHLLADLPVLAVTGVVVGHNSDETALPARSALDTIIEALRQHGLSSLDIVQLPEFAAGARWRSYIHADRTGALPDPTTIPAAAAATVAGFTIAASREDLAARYVPAADADRDRLRPLIAAAIRRAQDDQSRPAAARDRLARAEAAVRAADGGDLPNDDSAIADLVATFSTPRFRDAILAASPSDIRVGAEHLALHLWRLAPEPAASQLIAVIVVHACCQGDGAGARIALDAATTATPLLRLLTTCINRGVHPARFGQLIHDASQEAREQLTTETPLSGS